MKFNIKLLLLCCILITISFQLNGCGRKGGDAPVVEGWLQAGAKSSSYHVNKGDTLYSIAWAFNLDYRALAEINHLKAPYEIYTGQNLNMSVVSRAEGGKPQPLVQKKQPLQVRQSPNKPHRIVYFSRWNAPASTVSNWAWPAQGRVTGQFSQALLGNKGVNIAGHYGEPIRASANGIVVYSGDGVRGYGNLIIVKHNNSYLSAYAFNKRLLVKEGTRVKAGQQIAEMGRDNTGSVMLHFEIRRDGKPVNPLKFLS